MFCVINDLLDRIDRTERRASKVTKRAGQMARRASITAQLGTPTNQKAIIAARFGPRTN